MAGDSFFFLLPFEKRRPSELAEAFLKGLQDAANQLKGRANAPAGSTHYRTTGGLTSFLLDGTVSRKPITPSTRRRS